MTRRINAKGHVEPVEVVGERYCLLEDVRLAPGHSSAHVVGVCLGERAEVVPKIYMFIELMQSSHFNTCRECLCRRLQARQL